MRRLTFGWWVILAVLALSAPAMAHVPAEAPVDITLSSLETLAAAGPSTDGLATVVAAIVGVMTLIARRRRAVAVACMTLLLVVGFETGVHSVHHLGDKPDGRCVVASASAHTGGVAVDKVAFDRPIEAITVIALTPFASPITRPAAPDLGRAPPSV